MKIITIKRFFSKKALGYNPILLLVILAAALLGMAAPFSEPQSVLWNVGMVMVGVSGFSMFYVLYKAFSYEVPAEG
jgi:hypothetical protein